MMLILLVICEIVYTENIGLHHLYKISPSIKNYMTDDQKKQPSDECLGRKHPHPYDTGADDVYKIDVTQMCHGADFTKLALREDRHVELDMDDCQHEPTWGLTLKGAGRNHWKKKVVLPRSSIPGVDYVYTLCRDNLKSFGVNPRRTHSNLKIQPYKLPGLALSGLSETSPSVMVLLLDSLSWKRADVFLPRTVDFLKNLKTAHAFRFTSTVGFNTAPNAKAIFDNGNIFKQARGMVSSLFEDYSPENAISQMYPYQHYRISGKNILQNYHSDITKLYHHNRVPGCMHGEFWIQQHLKYIQKFWNIYPEKRKFHVSKMYGCHMARSHIVACQQNDIPLVNFLQSFAAEYPHTYLFLMSDHGFHWNEKSKFNEIIAGEYEHRNPMLYIISPKQHENLELNTQRFVSHYDVQKTLTYLLSGENTSAATAGENLIAGSLPEKRSCRDAGIPPKWCNCFIKTDGARHLSSREGEV